jgi:myosin heavy subunit
MLNRKTDDSALLSTFSKYHLMKPSAKAPPPLYDIPKFHKNEHFIIRHFAGEVEYSVHGFLSKNNISLQEDVQEVIKFSTSALIRKIFSVTDEEEEPIIEEGIELDETTVNTLQNQRTRTSETNQESDETRLAPPLPPPVATDGSDATTRSASSHPHPLVRLTGGSKRFAGQVTVSSHFRDQLSDLLSSLETTRTHYIKCIKPNEFKHQTEFNSKLIMQQLQCNGIMELVRIKRQGYPTHSEFFNFYKVFHILGYHQQHIKLSQSLSQPIQGGTQLDTQQPALPATQQLEPPSSQQLQRWKLPSEFPSVDECQRYCTAICSQCLPQHMFQIGLHKVFLRDGFEIYLREEKLKILNCLMTQIQSHVTRYLQQKRYHSIYRQIICIQKWYRCFFYFKLFHKKVTSILLIQSIYRMCSQWKSFQKTREQVILIQKWGRRLIQQQKFLRICEEIQKLQQSIRIYLAKNELKKRKILKKRWVSSLLIQKRVRVWFAKKTFAELVRLENERREAEEAERIRVAKELAEKERQEKLEAERLEKERVAAEEAERVRLEEAERARLEEAERVRLEEAERVRLEEAERVRLEEAERVRLEAEELERIRLVEEAKRLERERIAAEEAEITRQLAEAEQKRRSILRQQALESRKLIDERIARLIEFRAAVLIQVFFRLKCRRIRRPTIVSMQLSQPTLKDLVTESYCQHFIRNLKRKVKENSS